MAATPSPSECAAEAFFEHIYSLGLIPADMTDAQRERLRRKLEQFAFANQQRGLSEGQALERLAAAAIVDEERIACPDHEVYLPVKGALVRAADRIREGR